MSGEYYPRWWRATHFDGHMSRVVRFLGNQVVMVYDCGDTMCQVKLQHDDRIWDMEGTSAERLLEIIDQ